MPNPDGTRKPVVVSKEAGGPRSRPGVPEGSGTNGQPARKTKQQRPGNAHDTEIAVQRSKARNSPSAIITGYATDTATVGIDALISTVACATMIRHRREKSVPAPYQHSLKSTRMVRRGCLL
jgi:hypothetical protein